VYALQEAAWLLDILDHLGNDSNDHLSNLLSIRSELPFGVVRGVSEISPDMAGHCWNKHCYSGGRSPICCRIGRTTSEAMALLRRPMFLFNSAPVLDHSALVKHMV
jgi:hypothetical protein